MLGAILLGPEFCTDFGYYSDRALNEMGYNRYADFLKRGAPKGLAAKSPAKQGEWAQESVYSPQRCPLARLCLEATQSATLSKPSSTISKEKLLWYQLIGELLSPNPAQRPSLKNVQRRLKKLNKSVLIASGQDDPSFSSQLLGCFKRSKKIPERPTPSLKHSKPSAGIR